MKKFFKGLRFKLLLLSGVPLTFMICMGAIALFESGSVQQKIEHFGKRSVPQVMAIFEMESQMREAVAKTNLAIASWKSDDQKAEAIAAARNSLQLMLKANDDLYKIEMTKTTLEIMDPIRPALEKLSAEISRILKEVEPNTISEVLIGRIMVDYVFGEPAEAQKAAVAATTKGREYIKSRIEMRANESMAKVGAMKTMLWLSMGVSLLVSLTLMIAFMRITTKGFDEIRHDLSLSGEQVSSAANQLSSASQQMSSSTSSAAASLEESVASIQELASMVKLNSEHADQASLLSRKGRDEANLGATEMDNLMTSMKEINASSKKVEEIISVIDDIAFQTNLLALNAAVEAARAGEQGKGFAVVAEAVRTLAQKSAASAKEIADLIQQSSDQVSRGVQTAERSSSVLQNLVDSIKKISDLNEEIASASAEQSRGIDQITSAFNQLDQTVQGNASTSEEIAASAEELSAQSISMKSSILQLCRMVEGGSKESKKSETAAPTPKQEKVTARPTAQAPAKKSNVIPLKKKVEQSSPQPETVPVANKGTLPTTDDDFWNEMPRMKRE